MSELKFTDLYTVDPEDMKWEIPQDFDNLFDFTYSDENENLLNLYEKGKRMQWNASDRIDWDLELDEENPVGLPEELFALYGYEPYMKMPDKEKARVRRHFQAWNNSQFMHGEQGALICASKTVQQVPNMEAKFYAATQVVDEARHVEAYKRLMSKFGIIYPMAGPLKTLLDQVLRDKRWDMTYLGMQVVIEGLALAAFAGIRDNATNPLATQVNAYVMQDEARHVAFGRLSLREFYPQLTQAERDEREEFLVEACYLMRDRFEAKDVWANMEMNVDECVRHIKISEGMQMFRKFLFNRIVPVVKDIGLWGDKIQEGYGKMGVLDFANVDIDAMQQQDEDIAKEYDARREHIKEIADIGAAE